jgi:flagellar biosynthesis/type III secretory pathway protein FliH
VNENFEKDTPQYYHHYSIIHNELTNKRIEGLEFVFVELPKFKAANITQKKLQVLWLRFLTEIEDQTETPPADLLENAELREAIEVLRESAFTVQELETYDRYWDQVRTERTLIGDTYASGKQTGIEEGKQIGMEEGLQIGMEEGMKFALQVINLHKKGKTALEISTTLNRPLEQVTEILSSSD